MKCQNCGVNYLDEDRECPICGARAGTRGRVGELEKKAAAWREHQLEENPNYRKARPRARKAQPSTKPIRDKKPSKGKATAIVAMLVLIVNLLPVLGSALSEVVDNLGSAVSTFTDNFAWDEAAPDPDIWADTEDGLIYYTPGATYEYNADDYTYVYVNLYDLFGDYSTGTLSDGSTVNLWVDEYDNYTLMIQDSAGTYDETGYTWCIYNYPEEGMYDDSYPPDQYDSLTLFLTADETGYDGNQPERYDDRREGADLWLIVYVDRDTGLITLRDADMVGIFGADAFVTLNNLEQG